ncbi:MAG TPA: ADOP family duplicated permease [Thermoanaerobaculia bacterium]|nr:ADOP family duplicated permease [Thermoanaerobaculia bacterium]
MAFSPGPSWRRMGLSRGWTWLDRLAQDLRYAVRILRQSPGFTVAALATIGLGIAASVTVASFVDALFLRSLPVPDAGRLVNVAVGRAGDMDATVGYDEYAYLRAHATTIDHLAAHYSTAPLYVAVDQRWGQESGEVQGAVVSSSYFAALGLRPWRGRFFTAREDAVPDRDAVAVIGYDFWRRKLASDPAAIGRTLRVNERVFQIIGIMPPEFHGVLIGEPPNEIWIPAMMLGTGYRSCDALRRRDCRIVRMIGRLAPRRTAEQAQAELSALAARLEAPPLGAPRGPGGESGELGDHGHQVVTVKPVRGSPVQRTFLDLARLLSAAAAVLLLIGCANLGGLLLARNAARGGELALRLALGAGRPRLVRQLLTESLLLAVAGGGLGLLLSLWTSRLLLGFYGVDEEGYRHFYDTSLDAPVLACALLLSLLAGVSFGLWPALRCAGIEVAAVLKLGAGGAGSTRARALLTGAQVALSLALLAGAGLLARSAGRILSGRNFDPRQVAVLRLRPRLVGYGPDGAHAFQREVVRRLAALPGVESVSLARGQGLVWHGSSQVRAIAPGSRQSARSARLFVIAPRYFATLRIPLLQGRDFDGHDLPASPRVAIVDETLARGLWGARSPLDQTIVSSEEPQESLRVVGVVADHQLASNVEGPTPKLFVPYWQQADEIDSRMCIRTDGDPERALPAIRHAIAAIDPRVPVTEAMSMLAQVRAFYTDARVAAAVLLCSGCLALFLSAVGLYGVLAFVVRRRTREIGIRMAIGARPGQIAAAVLKEGLAIAALGAAFGLALALAATRLLSAWLYGVTARDPTTFFAASALLGVVALLACYLPARRAARVDPMEALREQ